MKLNYYQHGTGNETVVILHSGGETALTENEMLRETLSENYNVISFDLRGHGKSVTDDLDDYFNKCSSDVLETMDMLEIKKFHLIGTSIGALIAVFSYLKRPDSIQSIVLSGISTKRSNNWMELCIEDDLRLKEVVDKEEVIEYMDSIHQGDWRKLLTNQIGKDWYPFEEAKQLEEIEIPALICIGEDAKHELASIFDYSKNENIHTAVIPFSGHLVSDAQPEIYTQLVVQFLGQLGR